MNALDTLRCALAAAEPGPVKAWHVPYRNLDDLHKATIAAVRDSTDGFIMVAVRGRLVNVSVRYRSVLAVTPKGGKHTLEMEPSHFGANSVMFAVDGRTPREELPRKYQVQTGTPLQYLNALVAFACEHLPQQTQAAAEPESLGERGMSSTAFNAKYVRFAAEAWAEFKRSMLTQHRYVVHSRSKARVFNVGMQFTSTPSIAKSLIFSPYDYDTREEHVSTGYYGVQNLATAHNISVIHVQAGEVRKQFTVQAPRLDSKFLSQMMNNPEEGKRAFVGLRVNAVLTAILADIGRARTEAGYTNTPSGPVYWYDLNNFHYRGSKFRPDEMAG